MARTYRSKIDRLPIFFVVFMPLALLFATTTGIPVQPYPMAVGLRAGLLFVLLFALWTALGTSYTLDAASLLVRCGPFRWTIPLRDIHSLTPTRDPRSGPALSLDRVRIDYGANRSILISPRDRDAFIRDLEHRRAVTVGRRPAEPA